MGILGVFYEIRLLWGGQLAAAYGREGGKAQIFERNIALHEKECREG